MLGKIFTCDVSLFKIGDPFKDDPFGKIGELHLFFLSAQAGHLRSSLGTVIFYLE